MSSSVKAEATSEAATAKGPSRRMHFPYTLTAKVVQFPYKFHIQEGPFYKYLIFGYILSLPVFWKFQCMARTPENIKKWDDIHEAQLNHPKPWDI